MITLGFQDGTRTHYRLTEWPGALLRIESKGQSHELLTVARVKLAEWRVLLTKNVKSGREMLRLLLDGPIRFSPVLDDPRRGYAFDGALALDRVLGGLVELPPFVASPMGFGEMYLERTILGDTRRAA